ncbi:hypothetical protein KCP78_11700 [Salmonella enterica subsp. enterica]|nr:hypothetical protein KCP78_11700 [Salmonella enterica subsp. enterica]
MGISFMVIVWAVPSP